MSISSPVDLASSNTNLSNAAANRAGLLLLIAYLGFISLGLPDTVTGIAWPGVRHAFSLSQRSFGLISIFVGMGYFCSSFFAGQLAHVLGIGRLLAMSSFLVTLALFGNSLAPTWLWYLACGIVIGLGSGAIDAGLNTYVASHFSARHVNWLHACYSLGATLGPLLMTAAVVYAQSWRLGYAVLGAALLTLALCFLFTLRFWGEGASSHPSPRREAVTIAQALRHPLVWLQALLFFIYTGLELMVGHWSFTLLTESRSLAPHLAGLIASSYFGAIFVGRVVLGSFADAIGVDRLLRVSTLLAIVGMALFAIGVSPIWSTTGLLIAGVSLAPIFPCLMARTPQRFEPGYAAHAIGFQVAAAMTGAAALPAAAGWLAERTSLESVAQLSVILATLLWLMHELLMLLSLLSRRRQLATRRPAASP